jgi:hypothetical protein
VLGIKLSSSPMPIARPAANVRCCAVAGHTKLPVTIHQSIFNHHQSISSTIKTKKQKMSGLGPMRYIRFDKRAGLGLNANIKYLG